MTPRLPGLPAVRANMIASLDGAASSGGLSGALGGPPDKVVFHALRALADVILIGAGTMRAEKYRPARLDDETRRRRASRGLSPVPPIAVLTTSCRFDWTLPFFSEAEARPVVITAQAAAPSDRAAASRVADVLVAGETSVDLTRALGALGEMGFTNVLTEGGPMILGQLVAAGLLDELCLTLSPSLIGGDADRIVGHAVLREVIRGELGHVLEADGFLFLRYTIGSAP
ncbi:MAG TPA: pyrimidine reductase family protein [Acidimicrobiales bacterium]|nr:pyrimidine reductase family protein [Acidimicrobiales bacterium]